MGLKPSQCKLNTALKPVLAHICTAHLIHDDLIVATKTEEEHVKVIEVTKAISDSGLTLNPNKCSFGQKQISFWGMIYKANGVKPDPAKAEALDHISPLNNKEELSSFLCMMQLNSKFIENFTKKAAPLYDLTKSKARSICTKRIKLRHQDIQFEVVHQEGKHNQSDYLSRKAKNLMLLPCDQQDEADDINNLLYLLHTTPIIDDLGLAEIATETQKDGALQKINEHINNGKQWIPKTADPEVQKFKNILPEITITGNRNLFKGDCIILPRSLQEKAIALANHGSHPGQSSLERRLCFCFFFHNMLEKVKNFIQNCSNYQIFTGKKVLYPMKHHQVYNIQTLGISAS